jgi:hypothetical protein
MITGLDLRAKIRWGWAAVFCLPWRIWTPIQGLLPRDGNSRVRFGIIAGGVSDWSGQSSSSGVAAPAANRGLRKSILDLGVV